MGRGSGCPSAGTSAYAAARRVPVRERDLPTGRRSYYRALEVNGGVLVVDDLGDVVSRDAGRSPNVPKPRWKPLPCVSSVGRDGRIRAVTIGPRRRGHRLRPERPR
ncbi:hypothetical protein [Methanopyrus kandleri]